MTNKKFIKFIMIIFTLFAIGIISYVLFQYPHPGVADQGDFDRVMLASRLELTQNNKNDHNFNRYNYIITDYKISSMAILGFLTALATTSIAYFITFINLICKISGTDIFKTTYLAFVYCLLYTFALWVILSYLNLKSKATLMVFLFLMLFVFLDGNYLIWFNSLYGEPMMITTVLLYIASWIYYFYYKNSLKSKRNMFLRILLIFICSFLFIGSKMQVISALPIIAFMVGKLLYDNRLFVTRKQYIKLCIFFGIILLYPIQINAVNRAIGNDTKYNAVFYGILKNSNDPVQDLIEMGLNPEMAVEAGKHAYLPEEEYVKYIPRTEIIKKEFYDKISNGKLIKFYLTHPVRLIQGMEYTAGQAFITSTSLGKFGRTYSEEPVRKFTRFTGWSLLREKVLPKKLSFIILVLAAILIVSITIYLKIKNNNETKEKIQLFWSILYIGLIQFPMPYIGNGQADTAKQLYLFNFIFDCILVVSIVWLFDKILKAVFHLLRQNSH